MELEHPDEIGKGESRVAETNAGNAIKMRISS
jgi:hypothetical protein